MKSSKKNNKACFFFLSLSILLAFFSLTPQGIYFEEELGLPMLFELRGAIPTPESLVIVSVDEVSARVLNLSDNPEKWPRSSYAKLIYKINQQSPSIIAFNMMFGESKDAEGDQLLAEAIASGNNVILSNIIRQKTIKSLGSDIVFKFEEIINSIPVLEKSALATAPFVMPQTAATVKQLWAYKRSAGDVATFPVAIFQQYLFKQLKVEILEILNQLEFENTFLNVEKLTLNSVSIQKIEMILKDKPQYIEKIEKIILLKDLLPIKKKLLNAWLSLLKHSNGFYLNYYGGAETFSTIPLYQVLESDILNPDLFNNKIVLVGYSKTIELAKTRGLYTVFSKTDNDIMSPIEIAANAVANLMENTWLKPLQPMNQFLLIVIWSMLLSSVARFFSHKNTTILLFLLTLGYGELAYMQFVTNAIWLPIFIPLLVQLPLIILFISGMYYFRRKQEHLYMQKTLGLYIPGNVVSSMTQQHYDLKAMNHYGSVTEGVCMATDAGQYTTLSENLEPLELHQLINQYYAAMFPVVKRNRGIISDVVGDAMFAVWDSAGQDLQARNNACLAALELKTAVAYFNLSHTYNLPTRLGLNSGSFHLGNVGAAEHYEYRAVGDTVNTTTRIEGLNKLLGTEILVAVSVITDLPHLIAREIGFFILKGKAQPVHIYELIGTVETQDNQQQALLTEFSVALKFFQQEHWGKALSIWLKIERVYPDDGPTAFFIQFLKKNLHLTSIKKEQESQATVIKIGNITTALL